MRFLCCGLMSAPPERPCDDIGGLNAFSRETLSYAADFLDRPRDEIGCLGVALDFVFFGRRLVGVMLDGSHHGKGEHDERDVTMPPVPGYGFVVVEPELVFGGLEAILDRPAMALDAVQGLDRSPCRTAGGEVGEIAVGDITPDQQASSPKDFAVMVGLFA